LNLTNNEDNTMNNDKHSNNFAQSPHYHGDWHGNRFDMLQGQELKQANEDIQAEIAEANERSKANPSDLMRGIEAEQAMSRSEARAYKFEQEQSYRKG
jgi:hypothetical protein